MEDATHPEEQLLPPQTPAHSVTDTVTSCSVFCTFLLHGCCVFAHLHFMQSRADCLHQGVEPLHTVIMTIKPLHLTVTHLQLFTWGRGAAGVLLGHFCVTSWSVLKFPMFRCFCFSVCSRGYCCCHCCARWALLIRFDRNQDLKSVFVYWVK